MNTHQIEKELWEAADQLRANSKLTAAEYSMPVLGLVKSRGRTQATCCFVNPGLLRRLEFTAQTSLKRIEPHRLAALVVEDLQRYPDSAISEINKRIGEEISRKKLRNALEKLCRDEQVEYEGERRWRRYRLVG